MHEDVGSIPRIASSMEVRAYNLNTARPEARGLKTEGQDWEDSSTVKCLLHTCENLSPDL